MHDCPKYQHCSAPICPLDQEWRLRVHLPGERVCFYLTEYAKPGVRTKLRGVLPAELLKAVERAYPEIIARHGPIQKRLKKAAQSGSRLGRQPGRDKT